MTENPLALQHRSALPDEFRLILADYPREGWSAHPHFNGLAAFWLDRHLNFRAMMAQMQTDAQLRLDGQMAAQDYGQRLAKLGQRFLGELVGHHQIEDTAYFPHLAQLEPRIARGFEVLDADHHALHELIDSFAEGANALLRERGDAAQRELVGGFGNVLSRFEQMLGQHLSDEEDLVLPVVLKHRID
ncbi:MAG: hemerythrin domain-containing protein [Cypionkella sp.]|nr:hemerythrin domain-containing protein [Cypionkella sp.]